MEGPSILSDCSFEQVTSRGHCSETTANILKSQGYDKLTKIQLKALPHLLKKENCYIHARTGSGKTLGFFIPTLERLRAMKFKEKHGVGALIVCPTRELAQQTSNIIQPFADAHGFSSLLLIGGTKDKADLNKGAVIVVGTPGRLCQALKLSERSHLRAQNLKVLILDEADKLFDNGTHTANLRKIYSFLPKENLQKILVSATVSEECLKLAESVLQEEKKFVYISTEKRSLATTEQVKQKYNQVNLHSEFYNGSHFTNRRMNAMAIYLCTLPVFAQVENDYIGVSAGDRLAMLITVLKTLKKKKVMVFFNSCHSVKFHNEVLCHFDLPVLYSMGQEKQSQRSSTFSKFCNMKRGILLTTGMAERGWDIPDVHWIIVYDPPHKPEDYIHRIGRTGRGEGRIGQALLFLRPEESGFVDILHHMKVEIDQLEFGGDLKEIQSQIMALIDENKEIQEKAKVAYKKFVRAYQCHSIKRVFSIDSLDLTEVCNSFGFSKPPMHLGHLK